MAAIGTSQANHLVMATLLEPGDTVLLERPVYDLIENLARHLGAEVETFERLFATQAAMGALALILGVLALTGAVTVWQVYLLAFALGMVAGPSLQLDKELP